MRRRFVASVAVAGLGLGSLLIAAPAEARAPSLAFNGNNLSTYQANGVVWALASSGNTVFAGGTFTAIRPPGAAPGSSEVPASNLAVFDAATGNPTSCKLNVTRPAGAPAVRALNVSPDGTTLYIGGLFSAVNNVAVSNLAAVNIATCTPIATFKPNVASTVRTISSTSSAVYFGGTFTAVGATSTTRQPRSHVAAVSTAGALLPFAPVADDTVLASAVTADKRVILGGGFNTLNGSDSHALGVVDGITGANLHTFPLGYYPQTSVVKKVIVSGNSLYVANEGTGYGVFDGRTAINLTDYSETWRDTCLGATQSLAVYNNVLYAASHAHDCSTMGEWPDGRRQHLTAQSVTSPPTKLPWYPDTNDGIGEALGPRDLIVAGAGPSKYLWVGGEFTKVNGVAQQSLTRFGDGVDASTPMTPSLSLASTKAGTVSVRWRPTTDPDDSTLTYKLYKGSDTTTPYRTFTYSSVWWNRPQQAFEDTGLKAGSTQTYRMTASDGISTSALSAPLSVVVNNGSGPGTYASTVLSDNPSLYWRLDEASGTFAADSTPANNAGQMNGTGSTYRSGGALLNNSNQSLMLRGTVNVSNEALQMPTDDWSEEAWFKTTTTAGGRIIGWSKTALTVQPQADKQVYMTNDGHLVFGVATSFTPTLTTVTSPNAYNDGQWHHVVATHSSTTGMALYVDGAAVGSDPTTAQVPYPGYWRVGGDAIYSYWPSAPTAQYFTGAIDEVATYATALSPAQVAAHFHASGR